MKHFQLLAAVLAAGLLGACSSGSPEKTAERFAAAVCAGKFNVAKTMASDAMCDALDAVPAGKRPYAKGVKCENPRATERGGETRVVSMLAAKTGWRAPLELHMAKSESGWIVTGPESSLNTLLSVPSDPDGREEETEEEPDAD